MAKRGGKVQWHYSPPNEDEGGGWYAEVEDRDGWHHLFVDAMIEDYGPNPSSLKRYKVFMAVWRHTRPGGKQASAFAWVRSLEDGKAAAEWLMSVRGDKTAIPPGPVLTNIWRKMRDRATGREVWKQLPPVTSHVWSE